MKWYEIVYWRFIDGLVIVLAIVAARYVPYESIT